MTRAVIPAHIALHYLTCAVELDDGIAMNLDAGRVIEVLAERVKDVTLLAYDPPSRSLNLEDETPHVISPRPANVHLVSLGPKGSWRDYFHRRRAIREIVRKHRGEWDVLVLRLINRRAHIVWRASRWARLVTQVGGSKFAFVRGAAPTAHRMRSFATAWLEEFYQRRIIADADLTFVVGEDLEERYSAVSDHVHVLRESGLKNDDLYIQTDRLVGGEANFLFAGQLHPSKGVFDVLRAFARIKAELLTGARLHIVGDGIAREELMASSDDLGITDSVTFHGWIDDRKALFDLYRRMDVLLCLSIVDFLPRVVWEAFGSSVLVIATPVGALPKAFADESELLFVPKGSVDMVEAAVRRLMQQPGLRRGMLERASQRARGATLELMIEGMLDAITDRWPELGETR